MQKPSKKSIIETYHDLVKKHGGKPIGQRVFKRETGFPHYYWQGGFWRSWSAFQEDAGYEHNNPTLKIPDEDLLRPFAELVIKMSEVPTEADLLLKRKEDSHFPSAKAYRRWGSRDSLLEKVAECCEGKEQFAPVLNLLREGISNSRERHIESFNIKGFVYILRSGKSYKLGRSNAVGRRLRELAIQLPQKPDVVHVIETDDHESIEKYWHSRFC